MYENPLLPNKKLQELYALMQRIRLMARKAPALLGLEAVLASSLMQVETGDFVSSLPELAGAESLAAERTGVDSQLAVAMPKTQRLSLTAGITQGMQLAKNSRLAICFLKAGAAEQSWPDTLTYATKARLPLILVCLEAQTRGARKSAPHPFTSEAVLKVAAPVHLPVLSVDGGDAVAVYRVMQESVLRARTLGGVAVIWCSLPGPSTKKAAADPLAHMRRYLADRKLLPQKSKPASAGRS